MSSNLFVTSQMDKTVKEYDGTSGAFVKTAASGGALGDPLGLAIAPDGKLLVSDGQTNQVKRYDPSTGGYVGILASSNLAGPEGMTVHGGSL
jgi:glucose/arabinose dehydrogenase